MNRFAELPLGSQHIHGYFLKALASQSRVELLESKLVSETEGRFQFTEQLLITSRLCLGMLGQRSQLVGAFAARPNTLGHASAFGDKGLRSWIGLVDNQRGLDRNDVHAAKVREAGDKLAERTTVSGHRTIRVCLPTFRV
ncbi:MAG TPA: hypothetical protein VFW38_00640 [Solirubrobacteraceae bacterium]|nr:hypothetical protein [Solirubrobacteraceae bacterium]